LLFSRLYREERSEAKLHVCAICVTGRLTLALRRVNGADYFQLTLGKQQRKKQRQAARRAD